MKIRTMVSLAATVLVLLGCAGRQGSTPPPPPEGDFRGAAWGMGIDEIEQSLKAHSEVVSRSADELVVRDTLLNRFPAEVGYHFTDGRFRRGSYRVAAVGKVIDYTIFRIVLGRKYGPVHSAVAVPEEVEAVWLTPRTEIDLAGKGSGLGGYAFLHPERSRDGELSRIEINYYDRDWFARDLERTEKTEAAIGESEDLYRKLIGDWVQVFPSYRDYMEGSMMLEPGETYVYDPEFYDDF